MLIHLHYAVMALDPIIGAISAGNVVVIKPSEQAPACSSFLANILPHYLDTNAIKVIQGGGDVCQQLLLQKWDKIFFTGTIFHNTQIHCTKLVEYANMRNARNTLFLALSLTLTLLLGETHVGLTTLCGIHFQCVVPT